VSPVPKGPGPHAERLETDGLVAAAAAIQGHVRRRIEDAWRLVADAPMGPRRVHAFAVFDGLGGLPRGQEGAWAAADSLVAALEAAADPKDVLVRLNRTVQETGGCTTAVLALFDADDHASGWLATIGDSVAFGLGDHGVEALNELDATGPTMLTDFLGRSSIGGHVAPLALGPGDSLLLCTDGVSGVVGPGPIEDALRSEGPDLRPAAERLLRHVEDAGAPDNATVVLVRRRG
jgi:protein phosphatase